MENLARILIIGGVILIGLGGVIFLLARTGLPLGHLPGDISIQTENFSCFFPIVSGIILSIVLTILLNVVIRIINR
jgi:hypothetical protein